MRRLLAVLALIWLAPSLSATENQAQFEFLVQEKNGALRDLSRSAYYKVNSGDRFQFHVATPGQGVAYIFHLPSEGGIRFLGSRQPQMSFPGPHQWFTLDQHPGVEEFFVIFTPTVIPDLETLLSSPERGAELLTWVKELRGQKSHLAQRSRNAPAMIAGPERSPLGSGIQVPLEELNAFSIILAR